MRRTDIRHCVSNAFQRLISRNVHTCVESNDDDFNRYSTEGILKQDVCGNVVSASQNVSKLFGLQPDDFRSQNFAKFLHVHDRVVFLKTISDVAHSGGPITFECRFGIDGQAWRPMSMRLSRALRDDEGEVVCVVRELPAVKAESKIPVATDILDQVSNVQQRFLMAMSHELCVPLNAINSFSGALKHEKFGKLNNERQHQYVSRIHDSSSHLLAVVNSMLDALRLQNANYELSMEPADFADIVRPVIDTMQPVAAKSGVTLTWEVAPDLPVAKVDPGACCQILIGLLSNAIKFNRENGAVRLGIAQNGDSIVLQVSDSGIGMDTVLVETIAQPFVRSDLGMNHKYEGSGFGLNLVKGLINLQDGAFSISSEKGRGTTVTLGFPIHRRSSMPVPANIDHNLVHLSDLAAEKAKKDQKAANFLPPESKVVTA